MNTLEALYARKSVRNYTGELPTQEELDVILKAVNAAPIGRAKYDEMHVTVITNPELLQKIDAAGAEFFGNPDIHPLYKAPMLLLISAKVPQAGHENVTYSNAAIVAQNAALAATELGLGCCHIWGATMALHTNPELTAQLQLPEDFIPCCAVTLGKTKEVYSEREIPMNRIGKTVLE